MPENVSPLGVEVISSTQVFPESTINNPITTPLSIIDSTVSYFARCAGIWFYDPPSHPECTLSANQFQSSLSKTLESYRPWCGRLSYAVAKSDGGYADRYRRVHVTYNAPADLGVTFVSAKFSKVLSDFLPSIEDRKTGSKSWDPKDFPSGELVPPTRLSLSSGKPPPDAPNMIIQITTFACGSTSIAIVITHSLADAQSMCTFTKDWASTTRALRIGSNLTTIAPVFDPRLLDSAAAGNIDAESPDPKLVEEARNLPQHRFDWYKEVPCQPWPVHTPEDFDYSATLSPSDPIPWEDWDTTSPVGGRILHFTPSEIRAIFNQANQEPTAKISKHDALLAHLWARINAARQLSPSTTTYLNITMGLRSRLSLPQSFLGSPIMITAVPWTLHAPPPSLSPLSSLIRTTLQNFTPAAIGACLHDAAFEVSPQRLWRTFLGKKHILQTSWIQSGFQDVDFVGEGGGSLRFVLPEMGGDGLLLLMEALGEEKGHWTTNGVDVHVYLEEGAMGSLLVDPSLWGEVI